MRSWKQQVTGIVMFNRSYAETGFIFGVATVGAVLDLLCASAAFNTSYFTLT